MSDARLDAIRRDIEAHGANPRADWVPDVAYLLRLLDRERDVTDRIDKEWRRGGTGDPHGLFRGYEIVRGRALEASILERPELWEDEVNP